MLKICVVLTDGGSNSQSETVRTGKVLKKANVAVFAIGAGSVRENSLRAIAAPPIEDVYYKLDSVRDIPTL